MLFVVHHELGFDPCKPRRTVPIFSSFVSRKITDGDPLAFREVLPRHIAHPADPQHRQNQPQPKQPARNSQSHLGEPLPRSPKSIPPCAERRVASARSSRFGACLRMSAVTASAPCPSLPRPRGAPPRTPGSCS